MGSMLMLLLGVSLWAIGFRKKKFLLREGLWVFVLLAVGVINFYRTIPDHPKDDLVTFIREGGVTLTGLIDSPPQHYPDPVGEIDATVLLIRADTVSISGVKEEVSGRLRLKVRGFKPEVGYGDYVEVRANLRPLTSLRNPGGFNYKNFLERQGIRARATVYQPEEIRHVGERGNPILSAIFDWREKIRVAINRSLSPAPASILQAMIIGESGFLTPEIRDIFMSSGITHILSISGSHLSLVAFVIFSLCRVILGCFPSFLFLRMTRILLPQQIAAALTIPPVLFYGFLAGGQVATVRALWLTRRHEGLNALAIAALLVTLFDPQAILDISFQFSYGTVLAMILTMGIMRAGYDPSKRVNRWYKELWNRARMIVLLTMVAGASTVPLVAFYFNQFSWVGHRNH